MVSSQIKNAEFAGVGVSGIKQPKSGSSAEANKLTTPSSFFFCVSSGPSPCALGSYVVRSTNLTTTKQSMNRVGAYLYIYPQSSRKTSIIAVRVNIVLLFSKTRVFLFG